MVQVQRYRYSGTGTELKVQWYRYSGTCTLAAVPRLASLVVPAHIAPPELGLYEELVPGHPTVQDGLTHLQESVTVGAMY